MDNILIFGHLKPDTDSITSSISLSYLKNALGYNTIPCRLGDINKESRFVLDYFNLKEPVLIDDVKLQIKDLSYHRGCFIDCYRSINDAYNYMTNNNITGVPVVKGSNNKFIGLVTLKTMTKDILNGDINFLNTSYTNIINTLSGEEVLRYDSEIIGNINVASYRSSTFIANVNLSKNDILIVGDRYDVVEYAINKGVKLIILVDNTPIKDSLLEIAKERHINIIKTKYDAFKTIKLIGLSNYVLNLINGDDIYTFGEEDYYDEFEIKTKKLKHNNYPVIGKGGVCLGLVRITDINNKNRKKVILVDHNESKQSVEGLEEADILEIVDHHKLGDISTNNPINFRNMSVGSTNTIIYQMFKENKVNIPKNIAGAMLSGIVSDTLILTSPTTTLLDKKAVIELASIASIDPIKYALEMFKVGTSLENETVSEIINSDIKTFNSNNLNFAVSQVFTLDIDSIMKKKEEYIKYINRITVDRDYRMTLLVVTDIIRKGSYFFYSDGSKEIIMDAFGIVDIAEGIYIEDIMSRKKQIVPRLMDVMR